jgi:hypothetical protein
MKQGLHGGCAEFPTVAGRRRPSHGMPFARSCMHSLVKTQLINWVGGANRLR